MTNDLVTTSVNALIPESMSQAMEFAQMMVENDFVPKHLKNVSNCLLVIEQAMRWRMSPFAVAQATSVIQGKLMYEGKLVAAAVSSSGAMADRLSYTYQGEGPNRTVIVSGRLKGEKEPRTIEAKLAEVKTTNQMWTKQPDQQLSYAGARIWARRHLPEVILGVYSPEEPFDEPDMQTLQVESHSPAEDLKATLKEKLGKTAPEPLDLSQIVCDLEDAAAESTERLKKEWNALTPAQRKQLGQKEKDRLMAVAETCERAAFDRREVQDAETLKEFGA